MKTIFIALFFVLVAFQPQSKKILFIGDSLTAYDKGWQYQLCKIQKYEFDNLAVGGKHTDWMLNRLKQHLDTTKNKYQEIYIYGGINDAFTISINMDDAYNNIQKMVDLAIAHKAKPIIIVGYDSFEVIKNTGYKNEQVYKDRYIKFQTKLLKIKNAKIVPIFKSSNADVIDGIHLNYKAHLRLANWVIYNVYQ